MLKPNVQAALNKQIQHEMTAQHNYLALSVWFEQELLKGFAAYMKKQSSEENSHAMKILDYVQDANGKVTLGAIDAPKTQFASPLEAVKHARDLEKKNSAMIHECYHLAVQEKDLATQQMLLWFIEEQVEEEKWTEEFVTMLEKIEGHVGSLFMFDHRVSKLAE